MGCERDFIKKTMMRWTISLLCILSMGLAASALLDEATACSTVCHHMTTYGEPAITYCGCRLHGHQLDHASSHETHTDEGVCDYLCSIQEGGAACDCSIAIVPGRK